MAPNVHVSHLPVFAMPGKYPAKGGTKNGLKPWQQWERCANSGIEIERVGMGRMTSGYPSGSQLAKLGSTWAYFPSLENFEVSGIHWKFTILFLFVEICSVTKSIHKDALEKSFLPKYQTGFQRINVKFLHQSINQPLLTHIHLK